FMRKPSSKIGFKTPRDTRDSLKCHSRCNAPAVNYIKCENSCIVLGTLTIIVKFNSVIYTIGCNAKKKSPLQRWKSVVFQETFSLKNCIVRIVTNDSGVCLSSDGATCPTKHLFSFQQNMLLCHLPLY
ncbi:hypothetical protein L9F63_013659, partial [Diploptera punctata]